jgi:hypothetical protein
VSLIGKLLRPRNLVPVPLGVPVRSGFSAAYTPSDDLAYVRAFKSQGTVHSNVGLLASSTAAPGWKLYQKQPADALTRGAGTRPPMRGLISVRRSSVIRR